jgi:RNA polymerase sigma-70 factor (ECF subfamily)
VRGSFRAADPQRGQFRDYVKTVLFHLVSKYRQAQKKGPNALPPDSAPLAHLAAPDEEAGRQFDQTWREELLARAWEALADAQPTGYTVLRFRAAHPQMPSAEMAQRLSTLLDRPVTADWVRQTLHRARERNPELLVEEVARSLEAPAVEQVEEELGELQLLEYCRAALDRWRG